MPDEPIPGPDDDPTYRVHASVSKSLSGDGDWFASYITDIHIVISQEWYSEDEQDMLSRDAGKAEAFILHVGLAMNDGESIVAACDDHSAAAYEYGTTVIKGKQNEWVKKVARQFGDELFDRDVLAVPKMEIKPEYRGRCVGQLALLRVMQMFSGGCGVTLIKPWPLQYMATQFEEIEKHGKTSEGWTKQKKEDDFDKLRRYWAALGFERIVKSDFYAFPHYKPIPTLESLTKPVES